MCIVISSTVYGTRTFAALVKMVPGSKMFPAISVMILVAMVTLSVVSWKCQMVSRYVFRRIMTVGAGWNFREFNILIKYSENDTTSRNQILFGAPEISITVSDGIAPSMQSAIVVSPSLIEVIFDEDIKFTSANALFHPAPTVNGIPTDTPEDISGNILRVPSENAFPSDTTLSVTIATNIITDIAGNIFEPGTILTSAANVLVPYTVDEITIHIPYAMTLNLNTLSTDDYSITFGSNPPSSISTVDLSTDAITVILTMNTPFGTGNTPFVEQIGDITDTFSNAVTLQSAIADDRAPPTLVSVVASSPSDIIVTFSEKISSKSTNIQNYDLSGATIRNTGLGVADGTVVISTGMFVRASISISNSTTIEDISNNTVQGGVTQSVIKN